MKHPEEGVKTQPHIAILTFKSYPSQHTKPHCTLDIQIFSLFVFRRTRTTLYFFTLLRPLVTVLHFEPAGGRGYSSLFGGLRLKHASTPCNPMD
jgi:hypothetical protein